jgi:hypothetical protein
VRGSRHAPRFFSSRTTSVQRARTKKNTSRQFLGFRFGISAPA